METQRLRRRRSRRRARRKQVIWLALIAVVVAGFVWSRILIHRSTESTIFAAESLTPGEPAVKTAAGPVAKPAKATIGSPTATKNLIFFVGNGYGAVPSTAARIHAVGEQGSLAIDQFPETALVRTYSRNAQAADSAAAMTAYMTGLKVDNEVVSQTPETRPYDEAGRPSATRNETTCPTVGNGKAATTLLELAKGAGRAIGVVTTARVTQAVTAASYAHLCHRDGENAIAVQLVPGGPGSNPRLGEGLDVILGGGWQSFLPKEDPRGSTRADTRDLFAEMRAKGYLVVNRQVELAAVKEPYGKVVGLFAGSRMAYDADRLGGTEPSLTEMTVRAIDFLQRHPAGYVLVVEAGRIGEALDGSLARKAMVDAQAFDAAIAAALAKVRELDPDLRNSTIVVTADHDQTLMLNGNAASTGRTVETRPGVLGVLHPVADPASSALDATGRPFTTLVSGAGHRVKGSRAQAPAVSDLATAEKGYRYEAAVELAAAIGGSDVPLAAIGANAARFHGTLDNTQVHAVMRAALGL